MGAITSALAGAAGKRGVKIRTSSPVGRILTRNGHARGVSLEDGTEISARLVLSNADPKRTYLGLVEASELPETFREQIKGIRMAGPCAKVNLVLAEEPKFIGTPPGASPGERTNYTLVRSLEFAERCYDIAKFGDIPEDLWVDCVVGSNVDETLAPSGKHVMTCFVQYVPYKLKQGNWDENRELLADRVVKKIVEIDGGQVHDGADPARVEVGELLLRHLEDGVPLEEVGPVLVHAGGARDDVLVHQRGTELGRCQGTERCLDRRHRGLRI
jgi:phytoene dehydrogenase-like protein